MKEVIPGINTESKTEFEKLLRIIEPHTEWIQVDVHDGVLFPEVTWNDPRAVQAMSPQCKIELHLMVENPLFVAKEWHEHVPGAKRVIFHTEVDRQNGPIIHELRHLGFEVGLAINPETPIAEVHDDIHDIDELLIMTVHPGGSGQGMGDPKHGIDADDLLQKVKDIHGLYPDLLLGIDGGVTKERIESFAKSGISRFNATSAIFGSPNPKHALEELQNLLERI